MAMARDPSLVVVSLSGPVGPEELFGAVDDVLRARLALIDTDEPTLAKVLERETRAPASTRVAVNSAAERVTVMRYSSVETSSPHGVRHRHVRSRGARLRGHYGRADRVQRRMRVRLRTGAATPATPLPAPW